MSREHRHPVRVREDDWQHGKLVFNNNRGTNAWVAIAVKDAQGNWENYGYPGANGTVGPNGYTAPMKASSESMTILPLPPATNAPAPDLAGPFVQMNIEIFPTSSANHTAGMIKVYASAGAAATSGQLILASHCTDHLADCAVMLGALANGNWAVRGGKCDNVTSTSG